MQEILDKQKKRDQLKTLMASADAKPQHVVIQAFMDKDWSTLSDEIPHTAEAAVKAFNAFAVKAKLAYNRDVLKELDFKGDGTASYIYVSLEDFNNLIAYFGEYYKEVPPDVSLVFAKVVRSMQAVPSKIHMHYFSPLDAVLEGVAFDAKRFLKHDLKDAMHDDEKIQGEHMLRVMTDGRDPNNDNIQANKIQMSLEEYQAIQNMRVRRLGDMSGLKYEKAMSDYMNFNPFAFVQGNNPIEKRSFRQAEEWRAMRNSDRGLQ